MEGTGKADGTIRLIMLAHGGDKAARDRLVEENMGLVWSIVRRFAGRGCETEDLFQIGSIGLIKAIDKFDTCLRCAVFHLCGAHDCRGDKAFPER